MGLFRFLWKTTSVITRTTFYLGSLYTFFAYFYVEQIKHRLKDSDQAFKKVSQSFKNQLNSLNPGSKEEINPYAIYLGLALGQIYIFYSRAWNYRQYEQSCIRFHKNVIKTVLKNYESYGIFKHKAEMNKSIETDNINPVLMKKVLEVKEVNQQFMMGSVDQYRQIIEKQVSMQTGSIIGLTQAQEKDIDLIYKYLEKGIYVMTSGNDKYWEYKVFQSEFKRHQFNDVVFKLAFI